MNGSGEESPKGFRMNNLPPAFGRELDCSMTSDGFNLITFAIFPCEDLFIKSDTEFEICFPQNFQQSASRVIITAKEPDILGDCIYLTKPDNQIMFPWLEDAIQYPISVWFYAVRQLLKRSKRTAWRTPVLIKTSFDDNKEQMLSTRSIELSHDLLPSEAKRGLSSIVLLCGAGRTRGRRNYMEDVDFIFDAVRVMDKRTVGVYGVLDGHGGKECAIFAAEEIPAKIAASLRSGISCPESLFKSFIDTDNEFLETSSGNPSGSTANVMLWDQTSGFAYVANTADTRAVLCRSGRALNLSIDRKASDPEEIARIAQSGGFVANGRVQGSLAVSRALGDAKLKVTASIACGKVLIPDPEVTTFRPCGLMDDFVIIATDGLWDVMSSQAAVDYVKENLLKFEILKNNAVGGVAKPNTSNRPPTREFIVEKLCAVANSLADHAVEQLRSQDNVTVMVILITDPSCQRVTNGLIETIPDSYWLTHDVKMIGKEVAEESDVDVALLTRRRNSCDPGYMRLHMSNGSGENSTQNSRSGSRGGNENRRQSDVGLIQRLNSMSEIKKPEEPIVRRNSVFSKPKAAKVDDEKVTELKIPGSEKPPLPNSSKKKAKDEDIEKDKDDLMDFLLDDTNF